MKNLFNIFLSASLALTFATGCDDDDTYVVVDPAANMVKVVSRQTTLPAAPSQGKVVVEADAPVTVTSTADGWLTTSVDGNTILLNTDFNASLESRSATLTIKSGTKESQIAVIQEGVIVDVDLGGSTSIGLTKDNAQTLEYDLKSNCETTFNTDVDWVNVTISDGVRASGGKTLVVSLEENTTGHLRRGNITYKAGPVEGVIPVSQYEFDKDIAGDYEFRYYNSTKKNTYKRSCVVSKTSEGYNCEFAYSSTEKYNIPMIFDPDKCTFTINSASHIGTYNDKDAFTIILGHNAANSLYNTTSTSIGLTGAIKHSGEATTIEFLDNGSWSGFTAKCISIRTFNTNPPSGTRVAERVQLWFPILYRADKTEEDNGNN